MKRLALILALLSTPVLGQVRGPGPPPPEKYTVELTTPELNVVTKGLGELPLKEAVATFANIQRQIEAQNKKAQEPPK